MDFLEYPEVMKEEKGGMIPGRLKLTNQAAIFKNNKTGKVDQIQKGDIESIKWQKLAATNGLRICLKSGSMYRFGGFNDTDHDKLATFFSNNFEAELKNKDLCLKGWNWGTAKFQGEILSFDVDKNTAFEVPLTDVSKCTSTKNEVTLEFHQNDDASVALMELRFHIPTDPNSSVDPVQAFVDNILAKASIIQATGDAIVTFKELTCLTPRGRYDIKIFPSFIQLHGKTFDYKIPLTTILRLFLLPHKDNRQMFFVLSLDPPIKQGQTRYHFLILTFGKEEETTVELAMSEEDIKEKYEDKLQKEMTGPTFEVISRVMKTISQRKVTVPGSFKGREGSHAISCSYRACNGLIYPLERGFIYIHKPPIHIRFDEIATVNFARSGGSTRSFDFEIETKAGVLHNFSSIEKEEYGRLYDFANSKKMRIKNRNTGLQTKKEKPVYNEDELLDSDAEVDEPDAYLQRVKAEGKERDEGGGSTDEESSDESFNPGESGSEVAEEYDSNPPTSSDSDDEYGSGSDASDAPKKAKEKKPKEQRAKKSTSAKTVKEPGMRKKRQKKERDENKPKRPASAYFLFLADNREKIKKENPGIGITDITKKAGEMWKEVTDKTKWEEQAAVAKKEYEKAMEEYKASGGGSKVKETQKTPKKGKPSATTSPTKSPGGFKSKEYVSSSSDSSDSEDKPLKPKKDSDSDDGKMEIDEGASSGKSAASGNEDSD